MIYYTPLTQLLKNKVIICQHIWHSPEGCSGNIIDNTNTVIRLLKSIKEKEPDTALAVFLKCAYTAMIIWTN